MLLDIERSIKLTCDLAETDEHKRLIYDIESFVIDLKYAGKQVPDVKKQEQIGKRELAAKLREEHDLNNVVSVIRPVLLHLGISESVKGFRFIEHCVYEAAKISVSGEQYFMKLIYPIVANRFNVNAHNCERLCRYACIGIVPSKSFSNKYPFFEVLTRRTYEEVTVKELVDILVKYVLAQGVLSSKG